MDCLPVFRPVLAHMWAHTTYSSMERIDSIFGSHVSTNGRIYTHRTTPASIRPVIDSLLYRDTAYSPDGLSYRRHHIRHTFHHGRNRQLTHLSSHSLIDCSLLPFFSSLMHLASFPYTPFSLPHHPLFPPPIPVPGSACFIFSASPVFTHRFNGFAAFPAPSCSSTG